VRAVLRGRGPLPPEVVLEADDVVELGRRYLQDFAALERFVAVDPAGVDATASTRS
jgi:hypothetical protein